MVRENKEIMFPFVLLKGLKTSTPIVHWAHCQPRPVNPIVHGPVRIQKKDL